ncbi:MAG: hypothetical protein J5828_06500, partial [Desulfovibrionaceae bacterium]|nr:hypothetical protein [Desulfovibrionaceae bacterium]
MGDGEYAKGCSSFQRCLFIAQVKSFGKGFRKKNFTFFQIFVFSPLDGKFFAPMNQAKKQAGRGFSAAARPFVCSKRIFFN